MFLPLLGVIYNMATIQNLNQQCFEEQVDVTF